MTTGNFPTPPEQRYLEDYVVGAVHQCGQVAVSQEEIISFGRHYDPQHFHTDPEAAKASIYGGLIASGWHTCALAMRLFVEHYLPRAASLGSPGLDELRWLQPVRPGDLLSLRVTVMENRLSSHKPDRGIIRSFIEVLNQHGEVVMSLKPINIILCRPK